MSGQILISIMQKKGKIVIHFENLCQDIWTLAD